MKAAAGYVRISSEEAARDGYGLASQEQAIRSYCTLHGWELVDIYIDARRSGKTMKGREELRRLLDDAKARAFECVVFWKLDRLGRSNRDLENMYAYFDEYKVGVVSIQESFDTTTSAGRAMRGVLGVFAQFERDTIIDRITSGLAQKARQGHIVGKLPLGYKRQYTRDETGKVISYRDEMDPLVAPLIRAAYERYATGSYSMRDMAAWCARAGLCSRGGNALDRLSVRKLLSNETYTGVAKHHGSVVAAGKHPAIISAALFSQVKERMRTRRRHHYPPDRPFGREPYPLSGVATCQHCDSPLLGVSRNVEGKYRYSYYRCSTAQRRGRQACRQPMVRSPVLEGQVASYIAGMALPPAIVRQVIAELHRRFDRSEDQRELLALEGQLSRWQRLFALGEIDEKRLRSETDTLRRRVATLEEQKEPLDLERAAKYLKNVGTLWSESSRATQRAFVRAVFQELRVAGPQVIAITPRPSYAPLFVLDRRQRFGQEGPEYDFVVWLPGQDSNL